MRNNGYTTIEVREDMLTPKRSLKSSLCDIRTLFVVFVVISTTEALVNINDSILVEKKNPSKAAVNADDNLDNMVIERKNILVDFLYSDGGYLDVWKDPKFTRYYVTPICEIVAESTKCLDNEYDAQHPYIVVLPIRLWNDNVAQAAALAITDKIRDNSSIDELVQPNDCRPLPIKSARLVTTNAKLNFEFPSGFQPNVLSEGKETKFSLYPKDKSMCEKIENDVKQNPTTFLEKTNLYLEYTMTVGKQTSRSVNVTSESLTNSEAFSILSNTYENKNGTVYLTSSDMNKFSKDVLRTINIIDTSTSDYIATEEEENLIKNLIQGLQEKMDLSEKLPKDEWESVFWSDLFTRPDIETSYLESAFSYDKGKDRFIYDTKKEDEFYGKLQDKLDTYNDNSWAGSASASFGPFGGSADVSHTNIEEMKKDWQNLTSTAQKDALYSNNLTEFLKQTNRNVQWTGEKFIPKGLDLHRVNTNNLMIKGQIFYQKVQIKEVPATVKNRIRTASMESENSASPSFYEELNKLRNKTIDLELSLDTLKNQTFTTTDRLDTSVDALTQSLKDVEANLQNTTTFISTNINTLESELNNKIASDTSNLRNELINKLVAEFLTKADYERSLGLLELEQKVKYDSLHRHRLCRGLSAFHPIFSWDLIWPTWNLFGCNDFYEYVDSNNPFRPKGEW
uniref:LisH domain-containing protein n=1 Tax=Acrobeloides nanus TaxID=290746 RepID=A0A914BZT0_9BILA